MRGQPLSLSPSLLSALTWTRYLSKEDTDIGLCLCLCVARASVLGALSLFACPPVHQSTLRYPVHPRASSFELPASSLQPRTLSLTCRATVLDLYPSFAVPTTLPALTRPEGSRKVVHVSLYTSTPSPDPHTPSTPCRSTLARSVLYSIHITTLHLHTLLHLHLHTCTLALLHTTSLPLPVPAQLPPDYHKLFSSLALSLFRSLARPPLLPPLLHTWTPGHLVHFLPLSHYSAPT